MPIITKPATIEKDSLAMFTLDKDALAALPMVTANAWYGDKDHWKFVTLNYMSEEYGEMLFVRFDATQASPEGEWLAPAICQDVFQIVSISITDFANGTFRVPSSALVASEFEVDMTTVPSGGIPFQLFADFQSVNPLTDPTFLERTVDGFSAPISQALHNISLGAVVDGEANYDITFNLSELTANLAYGLYFGVLGSSLNSASVTLGEISSNYESLAATCLVNSGTDMNIVSSYSGGNTSFTVPTGAAKTIRIRQQGTTLEYYVNSTLISTVTVSSSVNIPYLYPYLRSSWAYTVDSVTVVDINNYIQWLNPIPNAYNIESDGGLTIGSARGISAYLNIFDPVNTFAGDFELIFNVGSSFDHDTAFGVYPVSGTDFCGAYSSGGTGTVYLGNNPVATFGTTLANKEVKLTRVGYTYSYYLDGVLIYSGALSTGNSLSGEVRAVASLPSTPHTGGVGVLNSVTFTV